MIEHLGDRISALLDGELTLAESAVARSHLATCPTCQAELAATDQVRGWVRALPPVDPPTPVIPLAAAQRRRAPFAAVAAAAAAVAAVLLVQLAPQQQPVTPHVAKMVEAHATSGANTDPVGQVSPVAVPVSFQP
ncbi:MAG TPA: zf-HC2 domain-containing protein [Acidimicrobiales bacterium]|nr:zf-HC2 domain-containing protein [Acidimicrobiales bacterium]